VTACALIPAIAAGDPIVASGERDEKEEMRHRSELQSALSSPLEEASEMSPALTQRGSRGPWRVGRAFLGGVGRRAWPCFLSS
jgi:hypothetical protein